MDFDSIRLSVLAFVETHKAMTPLIAGVLAFCESLAFLSLLVPATALLLGIGGLVGAADIPFWPVMAAAATGAVLGDSVSYELGRWFKDDVKGWWPMKRYPEATRRAEDVLKRWGAGAVAIGRFIGPLRAVVPLIAGSFGLARLPFQVANLLSAIVWAFVLLAPGAGLVTWFRS